MGDAPTVEEVKATYKKWVWQLHPDKNMNNVVKDTQLFGRLNAGCEDWKRALVGAPPRPTADLANFQFNPTYFSLDFCGPKGMEQTIAEGAQTHKEPGDACTGGRRGWFLVILLGDKKDTPCKRWKLNGRNPEGCTAAGSKGAKGASSHVLGDI